MVDQTTTLRQPAGRALFRTSTALNDLLVKKSIIRSERTT
jgi:hypothetical protein